MSRCGVCVWCEVGERGGGGGSEVARKGKNEGRKWVEGGCETCDINADICDVTYTMFAMRTCTHVRTSLYIYVINKKMLGHVLSYAFADVDLCVRKVVVCQNACLFTRSSMKMRNPQDMCTKNDR